ncbi:hypothetical protein [Alteromonas sp. KUL49]|uniref:hypothetical protein n=1 Tax=Alteromonas sp. KUL49 TaxID=2480798 RepID=UPI00102EDF0C|nr:hypothetical protein [Alteromonas sp. KUL49]TAP42618.1 hypothetical protein EYS00_03130 [Alteromonas sp. KUL49]
MLELAVTFSIIFLVYFFIVPAVNKEKFRLSKKLSIIRTTDFHLSFGQLSPISAKNISNSPMGYFITAVKNWPRGPIEMMITSPVSNHEIHRALENLSQDTCVVTFERAHFYFKENQLTKIKLKKTLFFLTIYCEPRETRNEFRDALIKLKQHGA